MCSRHSHLFVRQVSFACNFRKINPDVQYSGPTYYRRFYIFTSEMSGCQLNDYYNATVLSYVFLPGKMPLNYRGLLMREFMGQLPNTHFSSAKAWDNSQRPTFRLEKLWDNSQATTFHQRSFGTTPKGSLFRWGRFGTTPKPPLFTSEALGLLR